MTLTWWRLGQPSPPEIELCGWCTHNFLMASFTYLSRTVFYGVVQCRQGDYVCHHRNPFKRRLLFLDKILSRYSKVNKVFCIEPTENPMSRITSIQFIINLQK